MSVEKRFTGKVRNAGMLILMLLVTLFAVSVQNALAAKEKPHWAWTKENPKPAWWPYDHLKAKPVRGSYLHTAHGRYVGLMNPNHWPVNDWDAITYLYESLVYVAEKYKPTFPWLAETWEQLDQVTVVMHLRKGVQFHDGTDFNAASAKYNIDWINDKKNGAWTRAWIEPVKSVEVMDSHTLKWHFKRPWAGFLGMMALVPAYMISQKALEGDAAFLQMGKMTRKVKTAKKKMVKLEKKAEKAKGSSKEKKALKDLKKARKKLAGLEKEAKAIAVKAKGAKPVDKFPVGTGQFMLEEGRPGNYLKLKRNPNWWFGQAIGRPEMQYVDGYLITVIPDMSIRLANLKAGKLDLMVMTPSQYPLLKNDPNLKVTSHEANHLEGLQFNHLKGPCQDIRVRKAISHALDRKALIFGTLFGQATMASVMFPSKHWCRNPNIDPVKYDPELSKKLLAEAGYADGLTVTGYMSNDNVSISLTNAVKNMLGKVGIDWQVDTLAPVAIDDRMKNLEYDLASGGFSYIMEPNMIANGLYHPEGNFNRGRTNNPQAIALIEAGLEEMDPEKRQQIYWKLEELLYKNYEDVWLWYPIVNNARRKRLMGYDVKLHDKGLESYLFTRPIYFLDGRR